MQGKKKKNFQETSKEQNIIFQENASWGRGSTPEILSGRVPHLTGQLRTSAWSWMGSALHTSSRKQSEKMGWRMP